MESAIKKYIRDTVEGNACTCASRTFFLLPVHVLQGYFFTTGTCASRTFYTVECGSACGFYSQTLNSATVIFVCVCTLAGVSKHISQ